MATDATNGRKVLQMDIKYTNNFQTEALQNTYTQIGIFGYENIPSDKPVMDDSNVFGQLESTSEVRIPNVAPSRRI
jgi:hypothetical protein